MLFKQRLLTGDFEGTRWAKMRISYLTAGVVRKMALDAGIPDVCVRKYRPSNCLIGSPPDLIEFNLMIVVPPIEHGSEIPSRPYDDDLAKLKHLFDGSNVDVSVGYFPPRKCAICDTTFDFRPGRKRQIFCSAACEATTKCIDCGGRLSQLALDVGRPRCRRCDNDANWRRREIAKTKQRGANLGPQMRALETTLTHMLNKDEP